MIKYQMYPSPVLMGVGLFTFNHYEKYNWDTVIRPILDKFSSGELPLTFKELTNNSDMGDYDILDEGNDSSFGYGA